MLYCTYPYKRIGRMREPILNFDTHKSVKFLIEKGIKESQAESIVEIVSRSRSYDFSKLATKDQLKILEKTLKGEIKAVGEKIKSIEEKLRTQNKSIEEKLRTQNKSIEEKIKSTEEKLRTENKSTEEKLRGEIISVKHEILKWILPFLVTILLTVLTIFFKH